MDYTFVASKSTTSSVDQERNNNVQDSKKPKRRTKKKDARQQPMKVVYISNPMKFKTSVSKFKDLVQEFTGQDSEVPADPSKFVDQDHDDDADLVRDGLNYHEQIVLNEDQSQGSIVDGHAQEVHKVVMNPGLDNIETGVDHAASYDMLIGDDVDFDVNPAMLDNLSALMPSSVLYQVDSML